MTKNSKEYMKEWKKKNPDKVGTWEKKNPDKSRTIKRRYELKNFESEIERRKLWKLKNPEKYKKSVNKYWNKIKDNKNSLKKRQSRKKAYNISIKGVICFKCKKRQAEHRHHFNYNKPLKVDLLCTQCHTEIHHPVYNRTRIKEVLNK